MRCESQIVNHSFTVLTYTYQVSVSCNIIVFFLVIIVFWDFKYIMG